jgi:hypothetical protein
MAESLLVRKAGGGLKIEEALQNFTVAPEQTILPGTFVDIVTQSFLKINNKNNLGSTIIDYADLKVFSLETNKVVVAYRTRVSGTSRLAARIGTINGNVITWGAESIGSTLIVPFGFSAALLDTNKIILTFMDSNDTNKGKAVVFTVSGTSITWGSAVTFETASVSATSVIKIDATKVVVAYNFFNVNRYDGVAKVLTISGTTVSSFGRVSFQATDGSSVFYPNAVHLANNTFAITYRGTNNNGRAIIGTVSGTSITFGSVSVFNAADTSVNSVILIQDLSNEWKILVAYENNSANGRAIIGTVSGTSITWGNFSTFNDNYTDAMSLVLSTENEVFVAYRRSVVNQGRIVKGTISDTSITWSAPLVFNNTQVKETNWAKLNNTNFILSFSDVANSIDVGTSIIVEKQPEFENNVFNTTSSTFNGLAKTGGTAGQTIEVYINE